MKSTFFLYLFSALLPWISIHAASKEEIQTSAKTLYALEQTISQHSYKTIVTFIENHLDRTASCYLRKETTNLACAIEYIKEKDLVFIHLEDLGWIAKGAYKNVTKSILYDQKEPTIVANATGCSCCLKKDLRWTDTIENMPGIAKIIALSKRKISSNEQYRTGRKFHRNTKQSIIYKYYNQGSVRSAILKKNKQNSLSLCDKLKISCNILEGVKNLHEKNIVHLDIKPSNILINKENNNISAVITDLGGAYIPTPNKRLHNHGHYTSCYSPPEGFVAINEIPFEYHKSFDIYGVGCVLYAIFYEKVPSWVAHIKKTTCRACRNNYFSSRTKEEVIKMMMKTKQKASNTQNELIQSINSTIFAMLHHQYKQRPTAKTSLEQFQLLYEKAKRSTQQTQ